MPRGIKDPRHGDFRTFTRELAILRRELRAIEPEPEPRETQIVHHEADRALVMRFLLAKKRDERQGGEKHMTALMKDRQAWRMLQRIFSRVPPQNETAVNE